MRVLKMVFLIGAILIAAPAGAIELGQSGLGFFGSAHVPLFRFAEWYSASPKLGVSYNYMATPKIMAEVEYHYSAMRGGDLAARSFTWPVDKQDYRSSNVDQSMSFNSLSAAGILHLKNLEQGANPYVIGGVGFFGFNNSVSGLVFPGQSGTSLDTTIHLPKTEEKTAALTFSFGGGVSIVGSDRFMFDLRLRWNVIMGEIRPLEDWGLEKVFPMQAVDLTAGLKYFW